MATIKVPVYSMEGKEVGQKELNEKFFGVAFNDAVVHQVVTALIAQGRQVLAHTKGRGDVRGGGKKPWKQKGTGRARHGSRRSPIWVGGGITFGPTKERNFFKKLNKKMKQQAFRMVMSDKAASGKLIIMKELSIDEPKTKKLHTILQALPSKDRKALLVTTTGDATIIRAAKNLAKVRSIGAASLNVVDILKYEYMIVPEKLVKTIEERYAK